MSTCIDATTFLFIQGEQFTLGVSDSWEKTRSLSVGHGKNSHWLSSLNVHFKLFRCKCNISRQRATNVQVYRDLNDTLI